jgi:hypothetical protein
MVIIRFDARTESTGTIFGNVSLKTGAMYVKLAALVPRRLSTVKNTLYDPGLDGGVLQTTLDAEMKFWMVQLDVPINTDLARLESPNLNPVIVTKVPPPTPP